MRYGINRILGVTVGMLLLASCATETGNPTLSGEPARVMIGAGTRSVTGHYLDNNIVSLRIMTFGPGGFLTGNTFYSADALGVDASATVETAAREIAHEMISGLYDFVFIANEAADGVTQLPDLEAFASGHKDDLRNISFPGSAFNQTAVIPMLTEIDNVTVLPRVEGIIVDGNTLTKWFVEVKRLGIRIDMILRSNAYIGDEIAGIVFSNVPDAVPLFGEYAGNMSPRTIAAPDVIVGLAPNEESAEYVWGRKAERIILPAHVFSPANDPSRLLRMELVINGLDVNPSATIGYNEAGGDYTLPGNTNFTGEGIIGPLMQLHLEPVDWTESEVGSDITGRTLNVSAIEKRLVGYETARIYFNSNQESVVIEPTVRKGIYNYRTNDIFESIAGDDAVNFHYTYDHATRKGTGYVDLTATSWAEKTTYKLSLNAGGLVRAITVRLEN